MEKEVVRGDNYVDDHVDEEIRECIIGDLPKSFFVFAGAGSGKTKSLIQALEYVDEEKGSYLAEHRKKVAVITYTNAACEEIERRLQYKEIFYISTIHSFLWELIRHFQRDIKQYLQQTLSDRISELEEKSKNGCIRTKEVVEVEKKKKRLQNLKKVTRFTYNPNSTNVGIDSLSHDEVIKIGAKFLIEEETLQNILVAKYPFVFIDESQDTKKELVDALLYVYEKHKKNWMIGMFGDTMQKIYLDGKDHLEAAIPNDWKFPVKVMNHRSAERIVLLANAIRKAVDDKQQRSRSDALKGTARLFIANIGANKEDVESEVMRKMALFTSDEHWEKKTDYKSLILEHHMAASRFAFSGLFHALDEDKLFDTGLRDGSIPELSFLSNTILPLIKAYKDKNEFAMTKVLRQHSPLLSKKFLALDPKSQQEKMERVKVATEELCSLWKDDGVPTCLEILQKIKEFELFEMSERMEDILDETYQGEDKKVLALKKALQVSFEELERYALYISGDTPFGTQHGIKGLEFPRVMVILDDAEAKGFLFSYEKLFGAKEKTKSDIKNEEEGKDTAILRTMRLFYVACTRAKESLAVVIYTEKPDAVKKTAIANGWFLEEEIVML